MQSAVKPPKASTSPEPYAQGTHVGILAACIRQTARNKSGRVALERFPHSTHFCLYQTCIMMPTELSVLDRAERGDSHGKLVEESPSHVAGREAHRTVEPIGQPQESEVQTQDERLGE